MARPLPLLRDWNRPYWTSGADGRLRLQRCAGCDRFQHPAAPVCRSCGAKELAWDVVSGRGVVQGRTANPAGDVIAVVALDDDPRLRLTTRIVDAEPDAIGVGTPVEVVFEHDDDVWLPMFRPTGQPPVPLPDERDEIERIRSVRPMVRLDKFEEQVALTGVGMSTIGRKLMVPPLSLTVDAIRSAVADAGLAMDDIDGLSTYPATAAEGGYAEGGVTAVESVLGLRPTWHNGGHETPGAVGSIVAAMLAIASGLCRHVVCFRTVWQSTATELARRGEGAPAAPTRVSGPDEHLAPFGATALQTVAMAASQHMARYGTTRESLGWIALNARANAALDPTALYRDPMTMDDYLAARPITTPFGLYDCDALCDGAVAVVISAADAGADTRRPVRIEAVGTQITEPMEWDQGTLSHEPHVLGPSAHVWTRTELRPDDIDVAELYDGFSFNCLSWIEALGFCEIGEAKDFLDGGKNIARDGVLPLNTHGGQLSHGRTHGMGLVHEAVVQLRGDGGARQVERAETAIVTSGGLTPGAVLILERST